MKWKTRAFYVSVRNCENVNSTLADAVNDLFMNLESKAGEGAEYEFCDLKILSPKVAVVIVKFNS